ncbi:MAG: DMSO reductase [Betaproteobacteria bacterium RIFCSPLOWO2_02_FULL_67_19]|nr:MAG: DMSO reductase [Betaproteobacteria bacterium RIFCSPLOWO2_02_FULL_67_19]
MRPAWSVVLLTTLLGAGQGLFLALFGADLYDAARGRASLAPLFVAAAVAGSLALAGAGLAASFFHLGRPERAWRSAAMWRTSWLSREVIALPLFMALVAVYGALHWLGLLQAALVAGALAACACLALFVCTGMIYACLKFLQEWHSPLTVLNFMLLGSASGLTAATALAGWFDRTLEPGYRNAALIALALAAISRAATLVRNARLRPRSNLQTAIGVKHPQIAQQAQGAMGGSFNTREFFHGATLARLSLVKWFFAGAAFAAPAALLALGLPSAALAVQFAGLLAERWSFFAEARHPQNLYYQAIS